MQKMKISEKLMLTNKTYSSKEEALVYVCRKAEELGYTTCEFERNILEREETFPTGIQTKIPIAMPHFDAGCNTSFMSLTTLNPPIDFKYMDGSEGTLPVQIIFLFGIVDPTDQLEVLKKLMETIQNPKALEEIRNVGSDKEGCSMILKHMGELVELV